MNIRDADRRDFAAIDQITEAAYLEFAPRLASGSWENMKMSLAASRLSAGGATLVVAEHEGSIAGSVA